MNQSESKLQKFKLIPIHWQIPCKKIYSLLGLVFFVENGSGGGGAKIIDTFLIFGKFFIFTVERPFKYGGKVLSSTIPKNLPKSKISESEGIPREIKKWTFLQQTYVILHCGTNACNPVLQYKQLMKWYTRTNCREGEKK